MNRLTAMLLMAGLMTTLAGCGGTGNQTHTGELADSDEKLPSGEYMDTYPLNGSEGDHYVITVTSDDFDTYLILSHDTSDWQEDVDDNETDDFTRSQIDVKLPESGAYTIVVTSYEAGETGAYTLTIEPKAGS